MSREDPTKPDNFVPTPSRHYPPPQPGHFPGGGVDNAGDLPGDDTTDAKDPDPKQSS